MHRGVEPAKKATHLTQGPEGDEFDPVAENEGLDLLAGLELETVADVPWDDDLEFRGDGNDVHEVSIDLGTV
jgi:hypothetical protein